jgi:hypothetical protein
MLCSSLSTKNAFALQNEKCVQSSDFYNKKSAKYQDDSV